MVYFEAVATANANEYTFVSAESARDVKTIGAFAPAIIAPTFASAKYTSDLYSTFPASIVGTSKMSALPATSLTMPLCSAAICDTALSKASGPSTTQFLICPHDSFELTSPHQLSLASQDSQPLLPQLVLPLANPFLLPGQLLQYSV